jgi:CheY-like chemotaxis protein
MGLNQSKEIMMSKPDEKTILIVDDEPDIRIYLQTLLEDEGFNVMTASDGDEAIKKVMEKIPDFISLDLVMPKKSGIKFFHELRRNKEWAKIPVVVVTAHAQDEVGKKDLKELFEGKVISGPKVYLEKPVKPLDYVNMIKNELDIEVEKVEPGTKVEDIRKELLSMLDSADAKTLQKALDQLKKKE